MQINSTELPTESRHIDHTLKVNRHKFYYDEIVLYRLTFCNTWLYLLYDIYPFTVFLFDAFIQIKCQNMLRANFLLNNYLIEIMSKGSIVQVEVLEYVK